MSIKSLMIVGCGIKFMSHLTIEAKAFIEKSDKVLYLVNEPAMQLWIQNANSSSESLDPLYVKYLNRNDNYYFIADYIISNFKKHNTICVVVYGHPTVFVQPTILAAEIAKSEGIYVVVVPGISAEDCLFADLLIDPGSSGCQSFEATDFLVYQRDYDPTCHLILWQPAVIGVLRRPIDHNSQKGLSLLVERLQLKYSSEHGVVLYEAAQYPTFMPFIEKISLKNLARAKIPRLSTLYVPPCKQKEPDYEIVKKLKELF